VLSLDELRRCGLSDDAVGSRVENGRLHRMFRGVFAVGHANPPLQACSWLRSRRADRVRG
jgi:hypothetical protein